MTERVEVKTRAAAEKAIKAGKAIRIVAGSWTLTMASVTANIEVVAPADPLLIFEGSSSVVARGSSSVVARESSRVEAWGSSSVVAWGSSRVVAWGSSSVEAWGSSSVEAWGYSFVTLRSVVPGKASTNVCVNLWPGATCDGGRQQHVKIDAPQDWCEYYGARVDDGCAVLYKAVGDGFISQHGTSYAPGTMPFDAAWDGKGSECARGGGLNWSPTPRHTHEFVSTPKHYLEARVPLEDLVIHWNGRYPQKVCSRTVAAPLIEVDVDGNHMPTGGAG